MAGIVGIMAPKVVGVGVASSPSVSVGAMVAVHEGVLVETTVGDSPGVPEGATVTTPLEVCGGTGGGYKEHDAAHNKRNEARKEMHFMVGSIRRQVYKQ